MMPNKYQRAIVIITREQEKIIGKNLARELVMGVSHIKLDINNEPVLDDNVDPKEVLGELVDQYATIFGRASVEVAKEAMHNLGESFSKNELPDNLR